MAITQKKFLVTLEITTQLEDLSDDKIEADLRLYSNPKGLAGAQWHKESVERQKHLFDLVKQDSQIIEEMLKGAVRAVLENIYSDDEFHKAVFSIRMRDVEEIFMPVIKRLGSEDANFFMEAMKDGNLDEKTEHIQSRFDGKITKVSIEEGE